MGMGDSIRTEIGWIKGRISEYNSNISDLNAAKTFINTEYQKINDVSFGAYNYDVTKDSRWSGNLNLAMDINRDTINGKITSSLTDIENFNQSIDNAISKLNTMIRDCYNRISSLESELASLESST